LRLHLLHLHWVVAVVHTSAAVVDIVLRRILRLVVGIRRILVVEGVGSILLVLRAGLGGVDMIVEDTVVLRRNLCLTFCLATDLGSMDCGWGIGNWR
jgi:hypothetical protein